MNASTFDPEEDGYFHRRRHRRLPRWAGPAVVLALLAGLALLFILRGPEIGVRQNEQKVITVVLPPPPPPPPPPPAEPKPPEPKPTITPPKPEEATPPPPTQTPPQAAPDTSALTARTGSGPSNYGLQQGNGSGTRIGGAPAGDNGFGAYGNSVMAAIHRAADADAVLKHGDYSIAIAVRVGPDGRVADIRVLSGSGDAKRDAALQRLVGLQLTPPPEGLSVVRLQLNRGNGA